MWKQVRLAAGLKLLALLQFSWCKSMQLIETIVDVIILMAVLSLRSFD
jgi:hypothetical protein